MKSQLVLITAHFVGYYIRIYASVCIGLQNRQFRINIKSHCFQIQCQFEKKFNCLDQNKMKRKIKTHKNRTIIIVFFMYYFDILIMNNY